jgi:hypothetical protein
MNHLVAIRLTNRQQVIGLRVVMTLLLLLFTLVLLLLFGVEMTTSSSSSTISTISSSSTQQRVVHTNGGDLVDVVVVSTRPTDSDANAALEELLKDDPEVLVWLLDYYKKKTISGDAPPSLALLLGTATGTGTGTNTNTNTNKNTTNNNRTLLSNKTKPYLQQLLVQVLSLVHHPLVLLDIAIMILGNGLLTPWSFHIHRRLLVVVPWIGRRSTGRLALLVKSTKHAMQSLGKVVRKLYKRRSQYSVLSDYTWYVNSSNPEQQQQQQQPPTSIIDLEPSTGSGRQ